jgi:hypothetical protein
VLVATAAASSSEQAGGALEASLPHAERLVIKRQGHVTDPNAVTPVLERVLGS